MKYLSFLVLLAACSTRAKEHVEPEPISPAIDAYLNDQAPDDPAVEEWEAWEEE